MTQQLGSSSPLFDQRMLDLLWPEFTCSGGSVPPHGVIELTGFELKTEGSGVRMTAQAAEERYEDRYPKWINGPVRVESGKPGRCTKSGLLLGRMKKPTSDGDLSFGDWFVADDDTAFVLKRTKVPPPGSCFTYLGGFQQRESATLGIGVFEYRPVNAVIVYGKLTQELEAAEDDAGWEDEPKEATARVLEYDHDSKELDLRDETFKVKNRTNVAFDSGTRFGAQRAEGEFVITFTGC